MTQRQPIPEIPPEWDPLNKPQLGVRGYTYSHFRADEVSSAAQKAVRRCHPEEAVQWFMELYWTGTAMRTNIWNRALVMAVEDIGPAAISAIVQVQYLVKHFKDNPMGCAIAAWQLASLPKSRVNDWAVKLYPELNDAATCDKIGTPDVLKERLIEGLVQHNPGIAHYYAKALHFTSQKVKGKYKNAQWLIWQAFQEVIGHKDPYLQTLQEVGMDSTWRWRKRCRLLHIHVIHLWCNQRWPKKMPEATLPDQKTQTNIQQLVERHLRREGLVGVPDYALDKHTMRGKQMSRGVKHFVEEGAILRNEDREWKPIADYYLQLLFDTGYTK